MAESYSKWCDRAWIPSGASASRQYRARLDTTLYTYDTYCQVYCTLYINLTRSVSHDSYHWSASNGGGGTAASTYEGATTIGVYGWWTGAVARGHTDTSIGASGSVWASSSKGKNLWNNEVVTAAAYYTVPAKAHWTVSYSNNGGAGSIGSQTKWLNESLTLSNGAGFTRPNYKLIGWATTAARANAGMIDYALGGTYTANTGLTLYAVWELNAVPIKTKVSSVWKTGIIYIKSNGSWKLPFKGFVKKDGTWKQIKV